MKVRCALCSALLVAGLSGLAALTPSPQTRPAGTSGTGEQYDLDSVHSTIVLLVRDDEDRSDP